MPLFLMVQLLVKVSPGVNFVPSGMVSLTNFAISHGMEEVAVGWGNGVKVGKGV